MFKSQYLPAGAQRYTDRSDEYLRFILKKQLMNADLWRSFTAVFTTREDIADDGWRGEYFGKMMRGACLTYRYLPDEALYRLLSDTVRDLIAAADIEGRITTYTPDHEFCGWDMWVRKYVLVGCLYFYDICKEEPFRKEILDAMTRHLDYIVERIGEGKLSVLDTSVWYGGMNSSSILEPVVEMYRLTGLERYLSFAEYLIAQGGCKAGSVIEAVKKGDLLPHEFPTTKAYETMSYFEGILAYYEVTGKEECLDLVEKFADLVERNEITIIGCAGCRNEHFDHAALTQSRKVKDKTIMQETCVTVTWMRLQERLLRATGRARYAECVEQSALNALYGAINLYDEKQLCKEEKTFLEGLPFDSYSPLFRQPRGVGIGGFKRTRAGGYYGCCACIGAAGTALYPLSSVMRTEDGVALYFYHKGEVALSVGSERFAFRSEGSIAKGSFRLTVLEAPTAPFAFKLRVPTWSDDPRYLLNGEELPRDGEYVTAHNLSAGDVLTVELPLAFREYTSEGKNAFTFGPYTLARDAGKDRGFSKKVRLTSPLSFVKEQPAEGEEIRLRLMTRRGWMLFTDYASCGKHWTEKKNRISVWF